MSRRLITLFVTLGLALPAFLATSGCGGSKVTKANADTVRTGMSEKEVTSLLGSPTEAAEVSVPDVGGLMGKPPAENGKLPTKAKQAIWKDGSKAITVTFVDGKVVAKGFADGSEPGPSGKAVATDAAAVTKP